MLRKALHNTKVEKLYNLEDLFSFDWKLLTSKQKALFADLNNRFGLNLQHSFFDSYDKFSQFANCFAFHKDSQNPLQTGIERVRLLRELYYYETCPFYLAEKLNKNIEEGYKLHKHDIEFMIDILSKSKTPLKTQDWTQDPEDLQFQKELDEIDEISMNF